MSLITEAYFREGDFTRLDLIHQTYDNLNSCLTDDMLHTQQLYVGLSAGHFVRQFRQRALVLFKLMLLERKVLFFQSPVKDLCGFLLTLLSLHPGMLEKGLDEAARMVPVDTPPVSPCDQEEKGQVIQDESKDSDEKKEAEASHDDSKDSVLQDEKAEEANGHRLSEADSETSETKHEEQEEAEKAEEAKEGEEMERPDSVISTTSSIVDLATEKVTGLKGRLSGAFGYIGSSFKSSSDSLSETLQQAKKEEETKTSLEAIEELEGAEEAVIPAPNFQSVASVPIEAFGLPLNIFTGGNLCHPYLSLAYLDILAQPSIHGYLIGATNVLFKQKRGVAEVVVDIADERADVVVAQSDTELRKALTLTTEDLRFMDNVVKHVVAEERTTAGDVFLEGVGWEGGDEWVRAQFRLDIWHLR